MKTRTTYQLIFALFLFLLAACGGTDAPTEREDRDDVRDNGLDTAEVEDAAEGRGQTEPLVTNELTTTETTTESPSDAGDLQMGEALEAEEADMAGEPLPPVPLATLPAEEPIATDEIVAPPPTPLPPNAPSATFFQDYGVNPYILTTVDKLSTFSLDVDTGSYSVARRYLMDGLQPPAAAIRVEEFVNSFDQGYDIPDDTAFALYADGAPSPFHNDGTYFVRIGVKGYEVEEEFRDPAALTFVIDVSGSMAAENRLELVKQSLEILVERMRYDDTIAIVVYGSDARVVLSPTNASDRNRILNAIYSLETEGSTNMEAGLLLGYQLANQAYKPSGINRVILASDGVANVGTTDPEGIVAQIRGYADAGIQLTTLGFGLGNYNDVMMEQLADQGDGNFAYIDTLNEAEELFVDNVMSTLQVIGLDAKIQVEFDPNVVAQYRLIGYENRAIADEDFRNNEVDAAEFGAGHEAAAVYAVQFVPGARGRIAQVNLRWQNPQTRQITEINGVFGTEALVSSFDAAPLNFQLAVVVSQYAELLRDSYWAAGVSMEDVAIRAERLAGQMGDPDVAELAMLVSMSQ